MKLLLILCVFLTGCSTVVPVTQTFPEAPNALLSQCDNLKMLPDTATLSEVARTVAQNYQSYHECSLKHSMWIEWYQKQEIIFKGFK
jgi:hypothetical protein